MSKGKDKELRVMIINGSPRKRGYTSDLISLFEKGVSREGGETKVVSLRQKNITPCIGCFKCWVETPGKCIFSDDMDQIIEDYLETDTLVLATPVYYYAFSALLKTFIERLFPTTEPGLEKGAFLGPVRNRARFPGKGPKRCVLIASCALRNPDNMKPMVATFDLVCDAIASTPSGKLLRPESNLLDFERRKPRSLKRALSAFEKAGREIVTDGAVSNKTESLAMTPLSNNEDTFASHFVSYWTIAQEMGSTWTDRQALSDVATIDPRIIMLELASYLNPRVAGNMEAVIQFVLDGTPFNEWTLTIADGKCEASTGLLGSPDLTLKMSNQVFSYISMGRASAQTAHNKGLIEVDGDTKLLMNFPRLFPRPNN